MPAGDGVLKVRLFAPAGEATICDVIPAARALADEQTRMLRRSIGASGDHVPCRPGCSACCRYLVPVSAPEAVRLTDELEILPLRRRKAFQLAFARAARRINSAGPPPVSHGLAAVSRWYANMHLDCPLLRDELCSIYPLRPLACREFLVTSRADLCALSDPAEGRSVSAPVSIAEAIAQLWAEVDGSAVDSVLLPVAPAWALRNGGGLRRTFPAAELAERLAGVLNSISARTATGGCAAA
ncbi:MAG: YkgJ family cysteine cluster protein [Phycisphaerae bacterium]